MSIESGSAISYVIIFIFIFIFFHPRNSYHFLIGYDVIIPLKF
jgi:hypothetical protein